MVVLHMLSETFCKLYGSQKMLNVMMNLFSLSDASKQPRTGPAKVVLWSGLAGPGLGSFLPWFEPTWHALRAVEVFALQNEHPVIAVLPGVPDPSYA